MADNQIARLEDKIIKYGEEQKSLTEVVGDTLHKHIDDVFNKLTGQLGTKTESDTKSSKLLP